MMQLGGYYYELRKFDLALKYYEMASTYGYDSADVGLGYIWYYGRTGEKDYKKAFEYFSRSMERGNFNSAYKIADMYKNGYYVTRDYDKYVAIIEGLYPRLNRMSDWYYRPEICMRLARIREKQDRLDEAILLYREAWSQLVPRICDNAFFGNLNMMKWLIDDIYALTEFDEDHIDFYDLYHLLKTPNKIRFTFFDDEYIVESVLDDEGISIRFQDKWYRDRDEFFKNACIDGEKLTVLYYDLEYFELV